MLPAAVFIAAISTCPLIVTPAQLHWASRSDLPPAAKLAVVGGDPDKAGSWYTVRIGAPAGLASPWHTHPQTEYVTVLSGTVELGTGKRASAATVALPAGSYVEIPAGVQHFVKMKTAAVVQVSGVGPMTTTVVK